MILHSRVGYEVTLGLLLFSFGVYFLWKSLAKSHYLTWALVFLSLSTYAAYSERFIVPILLLGYLILFRKQVFRKGITGSLWISLTAAILLQIPNLYLLFTPAFFPKSNLIAQGIISAQMVKLATLFPGFISISLAWVREYLSQYVTYFSPQSLFFLPDPDLQRSIPALSVFYSWMVTPYLIGVYFLWKDKKNDFIKFLALLLFICPLPAAATKDPFATHRAIPLVLPLLVVITIGLDKIKKALSNRVWRALLVITLLISAVSLWRGYFVFLPKERAMYWQYGFNSLANEIKTRPDTHFVVDQSRLKPAYINLAFYLEYPPELFQRQVDQVVKNTYYLGTKFNNYYSFGQIETRNVDWETDPLKEQILIGDEYTISDSQAEEHKLTKAFEIRDPLNRIVFIGWETHPESGYTIIK
jgi:hypothetical protein